MKETRKVKILIKAKDKYKHYTLEELYNEIVSLSAKTADLTSLKNDIDNLIWAWDSFKPSIAQENISGFISATGTMLIITIPVGLITNDASAVLLATFCSALGGGLMGFLNLKAYEHKPISKPIAKAYSSYLGDKVDVLNRKRLLVDGLIDAKFIEERLNNNFDYNEDPSLTQEDLEIMK